MGFRLTVGEGAVVGQYQFMEYQKETHPDIQFVGLQTGWSASGEWTVRSVEGKVRVHFEIDCRFCECKII